jgi:hypothetical protein
MNTQHADFTPFRYSADDLPERDRLPAWRDFFGQRMISAEIEPLSDEPFHAGATVRLLPGVYMASAVSSPIRFSWTAQFLGDGRDDIGLQVNSAGGTLSLGGGRRPTRPATLYSSPQPRPGRTCRRTPRGIGACSCGLTRWHHTCPASRTRCFGECPQTPGLYSIC